jgi:uncharacterized protein YbjT (DUF2867 family)
MRLLVTGGTGVLGRALNPLARAAGHEFLAPTRDELDPQRDLQPSAATANACPTVA